MAHMHQEVVKRFITYTLRPLGEKSRLPGRSENGVRELGQEIGLDFIVLAGR